jgi:hypothetical protein
MKSLIKRIITQIEIRPYGWIGQKATHDRQPLYAEADVYRIAEMVAKEWAKEKCIEVADKIHMDASGRVVFNTPATSIINEVLDAAIDAEMERKLRIAMDTCPIRPIEEDFSDA